ncbi:type 1 fimbrial protein [Salmonella enterica]|nr:type 1 fimbrial protein [Salmonella enterica]
MSLFKCSLLSCVFVAASAVNAADMGKVIFTGEIVERTCEVPASQLTRTITLPSIGQATLSSAAENEAVTGATMPLQFDVTNCPSTVKRVGIRFDYTADTAYSTYMANEGKATGVLLGISKDADTVAIATGSSVDAESIDSGAATVKAKVNAYRTSATVTAGDIASTATVTVNYD